MSADIKGQKQNKALQNAIIATGAILIIAIWAAVLAAIWNARAEAIREAEGDAANFTLILSEKVGRSLTSIEDAMRFLDADLAREGTSLNLTQWAQHSLTLAGFDSHISIADPTGRIIMTSVGPGSAPTYVGDREHFTVHIQSNTGKIFISKPIISRATHSWTAQISKRIDKPDGTFNGVMVFSIDPVYFIRFDETVSLGSMGTVTLVGLDSIVRARVGARVDPDHSGVNTALSGPLFTEMLATDNGVRITTTKPDDIERIFAFRRIRDYPLIVLVGLGLDETMAGLDRSSIYILLVTAAATIVLGVLTGYLVLEVNRRGLREMELAAERTKLASINRDLEVSRDAAETANRAKSNFLANMSHELRTPLNAILGFSEVIRDKILGSENATYTQYAAHIHDSGNHLLGVINDVLDLAKAEAGRMELNDEVVNVADAVAKSVTVIQQQAAEKHLDLQTDVPDKALNLLADPSKLRQILINLLSNAVKFTPEGGRVAVTGGLDAEKALVLSVADTGIGMSPEQIPVALEPFRQIDSSLNRKYGGTGLGLPLSKQFALLHGGTLRIDSTLGKGTTVHVVFPPERVISKASDADAGGQDVRPSGIARGTGAA